VSILATAPLLRVAAPGTRLLALGRYAAWPCVVGLLVVHVPPFLRMGLDPDVTLWDLCARTVLAGGTFGRDAFENNLPGMLWLHLGLRAAFGWRPEVLRGADLLIVGAIVWLLVRSLPETLSAAARGGVAALLFIFYFSTSEWCHCQRDTWMLLPALLAVRLRIVGWVGGTSSLANRGRQPPGDAKNPGADAPGSPILLLPLKNPRSISADFARGLAEGLLWGAALWIKPFVAVPALACGLLSAVVARRSGTGAGRIALDGLAVLFGGAVAGAAGIAWLWQSGTWPYFADILFVWNREYVTANIAGDHEWAYRLGFAVRFFPWLLVHLIAVPVALGQLRGLWRGESPAQGLLAGFYLAWTGQAFLLQHLFDYVHVAPIFLGLAVVASAGLTAGQARLRLAILTFFVICAVVRFPIVTASRLDAWSQCFGTAGSADLRDRLTLSHKVDWAGLGHVQAFLAAAGTQDGEVTCFSMPTVALYQDMGLQMPTRHIFVQNALTLFRSHRAEVRAALVASRQRYVVCDVQWFGMDRLRAQLDGGSSARAGHAVFRSGRYVVFELAGAEMPAWLEDNFGL